ncbi:MAG: tetratricopeptide repeat protein [Thermomicrobiales bacterium]
MARRTGTSKAFTIFAIIMVAFLIMSTLVLFGGSILGPDNSDPADPTDEADRQMSELETRVSANPDDADAAAVLANIYANEGNLAQAIPLYEQATLARPDDGNLRLAFGIALLRSGSFLDARIQLEQALDLLPDSSGPAYYLGQLEQLKDDPDPEAAREWFELAIERDPESVLASQAQERIDELDNPDASPAP